MRYENKLRWWLVTTELVTTGAGTRKLPKIIAAFEFRTDAEDWARSKFGKNWQQSYDVVERRGGSAY